MVTQFYEINFLISVALLLLYCFIWHKHFDVHLTLIFGIIPLSNLGYVFLAHSTNLEEAILSNQIIYLGGCFLPLMITFCVLELCHISFNRLFRVGIIALSAVAYATVLTIGHTDLFYTEVSFDDSRGFGSLIKSYGVMHTAFYFVIAIHFLISIVVLFHSYFTRNDVSGRIILLLFIPEFFAMVAYVVIRWLPIDIELVPVSYNIALFVFIRIAFQLGIYDINDSAIDSIVEKGNTGFASFDYTFRYIGSNDTAQKMIPELKKIRVDQSINHNPDCRMIYNWIMEFKSNVKKDKFRFERNDRHYLVDINTLYSGWIKIGYQLIITDDTEEQKRLKMLEQLRKSLEIRVKEKTKHIIEMHDNLIMSMATMVESRDNSTGGHIKRTSVCVRFLVEAMMESRYPGVTKEFSADVIKAAPMHDLGKIAVRDDILRFNGRYNKEQYDEMKSHAAEGARIVHEILKDTDDESFKTVAENVAHYHHERWDGSGYPEGLKGEDIPLEARIMAIADVYDALVSKRCYKDKMSFKEADSIIMSGMGTQFDKSLEPFYVEARPKLEEYYMSSDAE
ncbi:MAG: HD domain-containing protein [Saccharofermentans sp.]|nr:HD domain-containing protein [Saccharofermentans sp.]